MGEVGKYMVVLENVGGKDEYDIGIVEYDDRRRGEFEERSRGSKDYGYY